MLFSGLAVSKVRIHCTNRVSFQRIDAFFSESASLTVIYRGNNTIWLFVTVMGLGGGCV